MVSTPKKSSNKTTIVHAPKNLSHMTRSVHSTQAVHNFVSTHEKERVALVLALEYGTHSLIRGTKQGNPN